MKILKTIGLFLLSGVCLNAQEAKEVPFDPSIRHGVLPNGMNYYIKHNEEPKERASFYFAQNVGSVLEKESQRGLAHFLEHMAFNGTEHYPEKGMLEYLEKNGIKFGSEINAFTSFDETVYNISKVPVTNPKLLDSVLLVLHDWSGYLSLTDKEIDAERGVINEEWRTRNTPGFRVAEKVWTEGVMKGAVYAERMPIGLMSVVNNFKYDELRDYYNRWYRPDQQAVIVVGDIDVDAMESKVKRVFSPIPLKKDLPERKAFDIALNGDITFIESLDKEIGSATIEFIVRNKARDLKGYDHEDDALIKNVVSYILNNRIREQTVKKECPALSASYSYSNFVRPLDIMGLYIQPKTGRELESFEFALTELLRFVRYGATEGELQRAKLSIKNSSLSYLKNKDKISSDTYAKRIYNHFFTQNPLPDVTWDVNYTVDRLETITNEDLLTYMAGIYKDKEKDIVMAVKGTSGKTYPGRDDFVKVFDHVNTLELSPYNDNTSNKPLIAEDLREQRVVKTTEIPGLDARKYELDNGATVVIFPTPYDKDQIYMKAHSAGGSSLLSKDLLPSADVATYVASQSGLGEFDKIALGKKLAGTNTSLGLGIGELSESLSGNSTKSDIEVLFRKIYLSFEAPRFDMEAYELARERFAKNLERKQKNKKSVLQDSMSLALTAHNERTLLFNREFIDQIDLEKIKKVYDDRFRGIDDFTFVFVGDIDEQQLLKLARKYIGNIKSGQRKEAYVDHNYEPAGGKTIVRVSEEMETPQATVNMIFKGNMPYDVENGIKVYMTGQLIQKSCHDVIREEEGGSYGVGASASLTDIPKEQYTMSVHFDCNPDMVDKLVKVVYNQVGKLSGTIDAEDFREVKESMIKARKEAVNNNGYWMNILTSHVFYNRKIRTLDEYIDTVNAVSPEDIKETARIISENSDVVEGVLTPKI
ncbi:M16 family metallopeptidase [Sinomicrobium weinanense]|uniref:Insulinase family protein n=1 Tax=Sinomicrobium weinanense TaxID=2842200 RepID=A0A926JRJ0_9FLAO|nr:M16 family metallopeptidase [Sinomicrobium weinanense]MBC9796123.1 insulinase family protein [Sinomicrobium weinanense]MBU3121874.1 insulinase family protein [Sinomicrobium weinanense]